MRSGVKKREKKWVEGFLILWDSFDRPHGCFSILLACNSLKIDLLRGFKILFDYECLVTGKSLLPKSSRVDCQFCHKLLNNKKLIIFTFAHQWHPFLFIFIQNVLSQ